MDIISIKYIIVSSILPIYLVTATNPCSGILADLHLAGGDGDGDGTLAGEVPGEALRLGQSGGEFRGRRAGDDDEAGVDLGQTGL
jgi:hypothetical protein